MLAGVAAAAAMPVRLPAQSSSDAALFLLLPVGARAVGVGSAMATARGGSDAVWWNPAGLALVRGWEVSLHHSQSLIGTGDALVLGRGTRIGSFALSVNVLDFGGGEVTGPDSIPSGELYPRNVALAGSFEPQSSFGGP